MVACISVGIYKRYVPTYLKVCAMRRVHASLQGNAMSWLRTSQWICTMRRLPHISLCVDDYMSAYISMYRNQDPTTILVESEYMNRGSSPPCISLGIYNEMFAYISLGM